MKTIGDYEIRVLELESTLRDIQSKMLRTQEASIDENRGYTRDEVDLLIEDIDAEIRSALRRRK